MLEESERLYQESKKLEADLEGARKRKLQALDDPATVSLVMRGIAAQKLLGDDLEIGKLQGEIEKKSREILGEEIALKARYQEILRELTKITDPEIARGRELLNKETFELKVESRVIDRVASWFGESMLKVETNRDGITQIHRTVAAAIEKLNSMRYRTVSEIRGFVASELESIHSVDLGLKVKLVEEVANARQEFLRSPR